MSAKSYYELLEIDPAASQDDIKHAFRQQIARYHPDKVQHLGREFQEIAATRAAELTEAYRILSQVNLRAEYDRVRITPDPPAAPPPPPAAPHAPSPSPPASAPVSDAAEPEAPRTRGPVFSEELASRDEFVRRAALGRMREALSSLASGTFEETSVRGFDLVCVPRSKMFSRVTAPRLLGRFVSAVDAQAVEDAWSRAARWAGFEDVEVCVLLMGSSMAPAPELAGAIAEQRKKMRRTRLTLIPVDARNWDAHMPTDAPALARDLIGWLRQQSGLGNRRA